MVAYSVQGTKQQDMSYTTISLTNTLINNSVIILFLYNKFQIILHNKYKLERLMVGNAWIVNGKISNDNTVLLRCLTCQSISDYAIQVNLISRMSSL